MSKRVFCLVLLLISAVGSWPVSGRVAPVGPAASQSQDVTVEQVLVRGNRRIPESTAKIWIATREGDPYNPALLDRYVRALYAQGHF